MVIEILIVVSLFLWFLSLLPVPGATQFVWATSWLAWIYRCKKLVAWIEVAA